MALAVYGISGLHMMEETGFATDDHDAQLMLRFKAGDTSAFDQLFNRHTRPMINFAYRFVHDRARAEELAQEIFLRVYEGAKNYRAQARFTTWLYRIATNVCLNEIRRPSFIAVHQPLPDGRSADRGGIPRELQSAAEPAKNLEQEALHRMLKLALSQLPEKQRAAFILNKYQEHSYAETAEIMKISEKAAKSLIHRAKEALAARLAPLLPGFIHL